MAKLEGLWFLAKFLTKNQLKYSVMAGGGEGDFSFYPGIHYYRLWDTVPKINLNLRL